MFMFFYRDTFSESFSNFSSLDITRIIIIIIILTSYFGLIKDLFSRFGEISNRVKILLFLVSLFVSVFAVGLLLSVYF